MQGHFQIFHLFLWSPLEPPWAHQWPAEEGYESHGPLCYVCSAHAPTAACVLLLHLYVRTMQVACRPCMYSQSICMSESSQKHGLEGDWRGLATVGWPPRSRCAMCGALRLVPGLRGAPLPRLFAAPSSMHCYGRATVGLSAGRSADCCTIQGGFVSWVADRSRWCRGGREIGLVVVSHQMKLQPRLQMADCDGTLRSRLWP